MGKYDDIIDMPHHVSVKHPQMAIEDRAAQFSPFAALTGHEAAIRETARMAEEKIREKDTYKTGDCALHDEDVIWDTAEMLEEIEI